MLGRATAKVVGADQKQLLSARERLGDADVTVNGVILDQGGPGVSATAATDMPSLGRLGLVVLAALLALVALRRTGGAG